MRLSKPVHQHAVFAETIEHAIRSYDGRVAGACQHYYAHDDDENMKAKPHLERAGQVHGNAADKVVVVMRPLGVRNQSHTQKRHERCKNKTEDKNGHCRPFQIHELRVRDLTIHLGERLLAAQSQNGMAESDENSNERDRRQSGSFQPAQGIFAELHIFEVRSRSELSSLQEHRNPSPNQQRNDHDAGYLHDRQGF